VALVTIGRKGCFDASNLSFEWIHMGEVSDDRMVSLVFQASDVFACPSIDDVGPMMINEAFMCGTPVVAFDSGVAVDLIISENVGYVAQHCNAEDFSLGLSKVLWGKRENNISGKVGELREACTPRFQARQYIKLFKLLLRERGD